MPRAGRAACIQCGSCVGFPCPTDAKNGTQNTMLPRALATGGCELVTCAIAERITTDGNGRVTGVSILTEADGRVTRHESPRSEVVVSAGAIETARLLLASRHRASHRASATPSTRSAATCRATPTPGSSASSTTTSPSTAARASPLPPPRWNHGNPGVIGGGMLADDFIVLPIIFWKRGLPPGTRRWGNDRQGLSCATTTAASSR